MRKLISYPFNKIQNFSVLFLLCRFLYKSTSCSFSFLDHGLIINKKERRRNSSSLHLQNKVTIAKMNEKLKIFLLLFFSNFILRRFVLRRISNVGSFQLRNTH